MSSFKSKLWRKLQVFGVILSVAGFITVSISQIYYQSNTISIPMELIEELTEEWNPYFNPLPYRTFVYPFGWLLLPAAVILAIGVVSMFYGYLVKRTYG